MVKGGKRQSWSDDEKRTICLQTAISGVSMAQVARRYVMNANMIFKWLKDPAFAPEPTTDGIPAFLPVEVTAANEIDPTPSAMHAKPIVATGGQSEIELAGGHRIRAKGGFDPDLLARLLKGLMV